MITEQSFIIISAKVFVLFVLLCYYYLHVHDVNSCNCMKLLMRNVSACQVHLINWFE